VRRSISIAAALALAATVALPAAAPAEHPASAAARTSMFCANKKGDLYIRKHKPGACAVFGPGGTFGGGVNLKNIKWSKYTGSEARGTATECGFHLPCSNIPATVRAYRVRVSQGRHLYTRLRAHTKYGTAVVRLATYRHRTY
jgi:hypothetical protein